MEEQVNDLQNNQAKTLTNQQIPEGYFPARVIAVRYGYSRDYLTRLLRKGHIKGFQRNNALRDWFIEEASLKSHRQKVLQDQITKPLNVKRKIEAQTVLSTVPFKTEGSLNAEPQRPNGSELSARPLEPLRPLPRPQRGLNPALGTSIFLSGIFFLIISFYIQSDLKVNFNTQPIASNYQNIRASFVEPIKDEIQNFPSKVLATWDRIKDLLFGDRGTTYALKKSIESLEQKITQIESKPVEQFKYIASSQTATQTSQIIQQIVSLPSDTLATLDSRIEDLDLKFKTLNLKFDTVPTIIQLPPSNTKGVGSITLNPQKVDTETLSVSSSATLSSLTVDNNATISGNLTVTGTSSLTGSSSISGSFELTSSSSRLGVNSGNTTNTMFEVGGTASISGALTLNNITYTFPSTQTASKFLQTDGSGTLSWATAGVSSNSLDFDEFVDTMLLDADLTINRGGEATRLESAPPPLPSLKSKAPHRPHIS